MKRTLLILIVILVWAVVALYSGGAPDSAKSVPADTTTAGVVDSVTRDSLATGDIEVWVVRTKNQRPPYSEGIVLGLNQMPDRYLGIVDQLNSRTHVLGPAIRFDSLRVAEIITDLAGKGMFEAVRPGFYQIVQITELPGRHRAQDNLTPSGGGRGILNYIRVAPDSVSVGELSPSWTHQSTMWDMPSVSVDSWVPRLRPRTK